jgi:EpsI family protein
MTRRLLAVAACLIVAAGVIARASRVEPRPSLRPLAAFPMTIEGWRGRMNQPLEADVLRVLAVDDYINRTYSSRSGMAGLYVGYYASQREGDTIHSPLNCLPGSGWEPISRERAAIDVGAPQPVVVNQLLIQKGLDRQAVLYWYQSHGRVVASEYWGRAYLALDALRLNRTDGAIVRIVVPVGGDDPEAGAAAQQIARKFARVVFPVVTGYLPN